jgi:hypothetical protein
MLLSKRAKQSIVRFIGCISRRAEELNIEQKRKVETLYDFIYVTPYQVYIFDAFKSKWLLISSQVKTRMRLFYSSRECCRFGLQ